MKYRISILVFIFGTLLLSGFAPKTSAGVCDGLSHEDCRKKIDELEQQVQSLSQQAQSLSSQIKFMDTQINLTAARITNTQQTIEVTEKEIDELGERIGTLNSSLDHLTKILVLKIAQGYKQRRASIFDVLLDPQNASSLIGHVKYLQAAQNNDQFLAVKMERTKQSFEQQKNLREEKKLQLEKLRTTLDSQKIALDEQKLAKQNLLVVTKNDERTYQALLNQAKAEYAAIQGIVSGAGTESKLRDVDKGSTIASIIPGASCNSSGAHLHFIVQENGSVVDPFSKLKSVDYQNQSNGDAFNPSGSWDWPVPPTIHLHQGYGETWAVRNTWAGRIYRFHNGIDITGSSYTVNAVESGELYRGSYSGSGGCVLPYIRVNHKDSNTSTLYLHVYAQ